MIKSLKSSIQDVLILQIWRYCLLIS